MRSMFVLTVALGAVTVPTHGAMYLCCASAEDLAGRSVNIADLWDRDRVQHSEADPSNSNGTRQNTTIAITMDEHMVIGSAATAAQSPSLVVNSDNILDATPSGLAANFVVGDQQTVATESPVKPARWWEPSVPARPTLNTPSPRAWPASISYEN